jgi:hypothetical protein
MFKKFTTVLGLALMSSSLVFAAQAPATHSSPAVPTSANAQTAPSNSPSKPATTSKSAKHHKRHHKKSTPPSVASTPSTPKQ